MRYAGYVQCFCNDQKISGAKKTDTYGTQEVPVCLNYENSTLITLISSQVVTLIIVVINMVLKNVTISLITWIGYDTHSEQITKITNGVFVAQFFNTAILILLVNANLGELGIPGGSLFSGPFNDYTDRWYSIVGAQIVKTMIINALMPPISEAIPYVLKWFERRGD